jgi:phage terminase Nu1 subunit (DNA packaging protein)
MADIEQRVSRLEEWRASEVTRIAVSLEQAKQMDQRFDRVDKELGEIKGAFWRVAWVIVGSVIAIIVTFAMRGGFAPGIG